MALREMGTPPLLVALDYLLLVAEVRPEKAQYAALRWHGRLELEAPTLTLEESQRALAALDTLCAGDHESCPCSGGSCARRAQRSYRVLVSRHKGLLRSALRFRIHTHARAPHRTCWRSDRHIPCRLRASGRGAARDCRARSRCSRTRRRLEAVGCRRHVRLKREVAATVKALNARKLFYSSELGFQVALVKERALQTYRDREKTAIRTVADIRGREGWPHLLYRTLRRQPFPVLTAPAVVEPVLDAWRAPITRHRKGNDPPAALDDPTARTIDDAIADSQRDPQALT